MKKLAFLLTAIILIGITIVGTMSIALPAKEEGEVAAEEYIDITPNELGGSNYSFTLDDEIDAVNIEIGTQIETTHYVYTYGYKWNSDTGTAIYGSLDNWTEVEDDNLGWGVAVKDRTQESYDDLYTTIENVYVKYVSYTFANCTNLVNAPKLPSFATVTEGLFMNCSSLKTVDVPDGWTIIESYTFTNCSSLKYIYIPYSVKEITATSYESAPFYNCSYQLKIYTYHFGKREKWNEYWNYYKDGETLEVHYNLTEAEYEAAGFGFGAFIPTELASKYSYPLSVDEFEALKQELKTNYPEIYSILEKNLVELEK